jgi:uncharacterized protein (DUF433 family)
MTVDPIRRDPSILGGVSVFAGSRVPVKTVMDYLEAGETIDAFLDDFPTVTRHQVLNFLEIALARATAEPV